MSSLTFQSKKPKEINVPDVIRLSVRNPFYATTERFLEIIDQESKLDQKERQDVKRNKF